MAARQKILKTCPRGHQFYKSSDCNTCPVCTQLEKPNSGFLAPFSSPARNALAREGIDTIEKLAAYTEKEILALHGIGKSSLPRFYEALEAAGLQFKQPEK
ncbi:MAG: hypothetical protein JNM21_11100 [Taibaiella sp.]|nr:hypothetical protein [Taibaiella sp.]